MPGISQERRATQNIEQLAHATDAPLEQTYIQHACVHPLACMDVTKLKNPHRFPQLIANSNPFHAKNPWYRAGVLSSARNVSPPHRHHCQVSVFRDDIAISISPA